jgi:hypothetical protein
MSEMTALFEQGKIRTGSARRCHCARCSERTSGLGPAMAPAR